MVESRLTTEFFEDTLSVIIIDTVGCFVSYIAESCAKKNLTSYELSIFDVLIPESQEALEKAYKVVVCLSPALFDPHFEVVLEQLKPFQDKLYLVVPIISGSKEQVEGEIPYLSKYFASQNQLIALCNELLPQATFIFGQDVTLPPGKLCLFELLCQNIQSGFVFVPNIHISAHSLPEFCEQAVLEMVRPHRMSVSIKGKTKFAQSILEKIARQYEGYYFCQIGIQRVDAYEVASVPFTVKDVSISCDEETIARWFSRQLPSPEIKPFFVPTEFHFYQAKVADQHQVNTAQLPQYEPLPELPLVEPIQPDIWAESIKQENQKAEQLFPLYAHIITLDKVSVSEEPTLTNTEIRRELANSRVKNSPDTETDILDEFNVSSEIQRIFTHTRQEQKAERVISLANVRKNISKKSKKKTSLFYGGLGFVGIGITALVLSIIFWGSTLLLKSQVLAILSSPVQEISNGQLQRAQLMSDFVQAQVQVYEKIFEVSHLEEAKKVMAIEDQLAVLHNPDSQATQNVKNLFKLIIGTSTGDITQLAENITSETLSTYEAANTVEQSLQQISFRDVSKSEQVQKAYQEKIGEYKKQALIIQQLGPYIPSIFGNMQKRNYAFILQNNQELRPTGGFMDAVAILTFEKGSLVDRKVYTSHELDKLMTGEVAAPTEILQVLGQKQFSFYDSNWSPDFPTSAVTIQWFLEKILNQKIDGVMTVDLYGVQEFLEATGPLDLPEYNEVITHKNLLERLEFHSEVVLVETEKNHDYRKLLFSHLLDKLVNLPEDEIVPFLSALQSATTKKSVLISLAQQEESAVFQNLNLSGAQLVPRCPAEFSGVDCFVDHFMQAEANIGINKANFYLKRSIDHHIAVASTQAEHTHQVLYENTAQLEAWPKGTYLNYLRLYLPSSAKNISISIGDTLIPEKQITKYSEKDMVVVGVIVEVPIKTAVQVTTKYTVPLTLDNKRFSYVFFNNEQPGNGETPHKVIITSSPTLIPQVIAPQAVVGEDGIVFTRPNDESSLFAVEFTQAK